MVTVVGASTRAGAVKTAVDCPVGVASAGDHETAPVVTPETAADSRAVSPGLKVDGCAVTLTAAEAICTGTVTGSPTGGCGLKTTLAVRTNPGRMVVGA
jgi:hypothetical protein